MPNVGKFGKWVADLMNRAKTGVGSRLGPRVASAREGARARWVAIPKKKLAMGAGAGGVLIGAGLYGGYKVRRRAQRLAMEYANDGYRRPVDIGAQQVALQGFTQPTSKSAYGGQPPRRFRRFMY